MKSNIGILLLVCLVTKSFSQNVFTARNTSFSKAFEQILLDYPNNFQNISGDLVLSQGEYEHYASRIALPGAKQCIVGKYHSIEDTTASWQATMPAFESFEEAAKQYRQLFRQLKTAPVTLVDGSKLYLVGDIAEIDESLDFSVSTLYFPTADLRYRHFKIELELLYSMHEWVIHLNMVRRKPDDQRW